MVKSLNLLVSGNLLRRVLGLSLDGHELVFLLLAHALLEVPPLLLEKVLEPLELVDVQLLQSDELVPHYSDDFFGRVNAGVPDEKKTN